MVSRTRSALIALGILALGGTAARADIASSPTWGSLAGSIAVTTDYIFRGQTQTRGDIAFQGSLNYFHPSGLYAGLWVSNVHFAPGDDAPVELDWTAGFSKTVGKITYDFGFIYYQYPGSTAAFNDDYYELYGKGAYDFGFLQLGAAINGSPDYINATGGTIYYSGNLNVPLGILNLPGNPSFSATGGYLTYLDEGRKNFAHDYWNWSAGVSATAIGLGFDLRYYGVSLPKIEPWTAQTADGTVVFTVTKSF